MQAAEEEIKQLKEKLAATEAGVLKEQQQRIDELARWAKTHIHKMVICCGYHSRVPKPNSHIGDCPALQ